VSIRTTDFSGRFCCGFTHRGGVSAQDFPVPLLDAKRRTARLITRHFRFAHAYMKQDKTIELEGRITNVLPGTMFHVELENKHTVLAHISGKMRKRFIRLLNGDRVKLEMSPYDLNKARIVYRLG